MTACCNWCLALVKAPVDYNRMIHRLYCSSHCLEKDFLFRKWQNDDWLTIVAERKRDGQSEDK